MSLICRTCSQTKTKLVNVFNYYDNSNLLSEMLKECTSVEIKKCDRLPLRICSECLDSLISAWHFRRMTIETDLKLRNVFCEQRLADTFQHKDNDLTIIEKEIIIKDEPCDPIIIENECVYVTDVNYGQIKQENPTTSIPENDESSLLVSTCNVRKNFPPASCINPGIGLDIQHCDVLQLQHVVDNNIMDHNYPSKYQSISNSIINSQKLTESLLQCKAEHVDNLFNTAICKNNLSRTEAQLKINKQSYQEKSTYCENEIVPLITNTEQPITISQSLDISHSFNAKTKSQNSYFVAQAIKTDVQQETSQQKDASSVDDNGNDELNIRPNKLEILGECRKLTHEEKKKTSVRCRICNKIFKYYYYYQVHLRYHKDDLPQKCKTCGKGFPRPSLLKAHAITHSETRPFACDACRKTFKEAGALQQHKLTHFADRPYKCNLCHLDFKVERTLKTHLKRHENKRDHICETCGKGFVTRGDLRIHMKIHLDTKDYLCTECGKPFSTSSRLHIHFRHNHSNERPHACAHCDRRFKDKRTMQMHSLIHTGEKPHLCKLCSKSFRQGAALRTHMRIHTGNTPYACKLCPSQFKYNQILTNHMKTHK